MEADCLELMAQFEKMTDWEDDHFTEKDVLDAPQSFEDKGLITYPVNNISNRRRLVIPKNKRNYRKQAEIKLINFVRKELNGNKDWKNKEGRSIQ